MLAFTKWIFGSLKPWYRSNPVYYRSKQQNIYHCTVQKCASQWVRDLLADQRTYRYCGLSTYHHEHQKFGGYDRRNLTDRYYLEAFPPSTIATPLYIHYEGFAAIPKPARYKAFFVMRDPRDVLISWYFSIKYSHPATTEVDAVRQELNRFTQSEGLLYAVDFLNDYGLFAAQRSWANASLKDANILLVRYEDLFVPDNLPVVKRLLEHCDIRMPAETLTDVLTSYSFEQLSGRQRGQEDRNAHYRKGIVGDWRNYFDTRIAARFGEVAGDLLGLWNYECDV